MSRLDEMMESDRLRVLCEYENRDASKRMERLKGAQVLHQQIEENEQSRLLEQEKKDQETKVSLALRFLFTSRIMWMFIKNLPIFGVAVNYNTKTSKLQS